MGEPADSRFERRGQGAQWRIWWWLARSNAGTGGRAAAHARHGQAAGGGTRESAVRLRSGQARGASSGREVRLG